MKRMSYLKKIIILSTFLVLFTGAMFYFVYGFMDQRNENRASQLSQKSLELEVLKREQISFEQGLKDLALLEKATYPPEELFSRDTKLVKEIQQLESVAQLYDLTLSIAISGSTQTAVKIKGTKAELYAIPYVLSLTGDFGNTMLFIQAMEHLPFVTNAKTVSITTSPAEGTTTTINAEFYIKK